MNKASMWRGVLCFALLLVGFALVAPPKASVSYSAVNRSGSGEVRRSAPLAALISQQSGESPLYKQPCNGTADDRQSDLCAQWTSADWTMAGVLIGIFGTVALLVQIGFTWRALGQGTRALTAAVAANNIAEKALLQDSRAWLKVDLELDGTLEVAGEPPDLRCSVLVSVTNLGNRPATNVGVAIEIVGNERLRLLEKQQDVAKHESEAPDRAKIPNATIFPGDDPVVTSWNIGTGFDKLAALLERFTHEGVRRIHLPLGIIGCVQYRIPGSTKLHQTGFIYELRRVPIHNVVGSAIAYQDLPLKAHELQLSPSFEGHGTID